MTDPNHWNAAYGSRPEDRQSWFEAAPLTAKLVQEFCSPDRPMIDVGGGASRLVDVLLGAGYRDLTVLDLSGAALEVARARLGPDAGKVRWIEADITGWVPDRRFALWHDRAAFHFLTAEDDRRAYVRALCDGIEPGGHAILSTFDADGPDRCSGLPVVRYAPQALAEEIARHAPGAFAPVRAMHNVHATPAGMTQRFQTSVLRRLP